MCGIPVCSARVIFESDLMQDFLNPSGKENGMCATQATPPQDRKFSLRVLLPNRSICTVSVRDNSRTMEVFEVSSLQDRLCKYECNRCGDPYLLFWCRL